MAKAKAPRQRRWFVLATLVGAAAWYARSRTVTRPQVNALSPTGAGRFTLTPEIVTPGTGAAELSEFGVSETVTPEFGIPEVAPDVDDAGTDGAEAAGAPGFLSSSVPAEIDRAAGESGADAHDLDEAGPTVAGQTGELPTTPSPRPRPRPRHSPEPASESTPLTPATVAPDAAPTGGTGSFSAAPVSAIAPAAAPVSAIAVASAAGLPSDDGSRVPNIAPASDPVPPSAIAPVSAAAPASDTTPVPDPAPVTDDAPVFDPAPVFADTPVSNTAPVSDDAPVFDPAPVFADTPVYADPPVLDDTPRSGAAPAWDDALASDTPSAHTFDGGDPATGFGPTSANTLPTPNALFTPTHGMGAVAGPDGEAPAPEFTVKGSADSMIFHTPVSPYYDRTRAEVWFRSADEAVAAGFTEYRSQQHTG